MIETKYPDAPKSLDEAKRLVEREFLGCCGIHGVGKKISMNAIRIYADAETSQLKDVLERIRNQCAPFLVKLVVEGRPQASE